ncbi:LysM peptidoglycan-binding domain-containing protein [Vaginisenegalia massiliensis]|uniref:LysM peptidoglycan-binding domain-containing protein n=1 Tax=Vaginisenegalia massiliensis TaxID=2058294 RepID=UPI000F53582B|nr:LysM peptidoglycan-binding domain-containing protein [Vaginisenegalia massiliensis]
MNISRYTVIERKKAEKRLASAKSLLKQFNTGLVLLSSGAILSQVAAQATPVYAYDAKTTQQEFLNKIGDYAKKIAKENDLYASVMIAQAILESGWGQSTLAKAPNYNLFGIKGKYNGQSAVMNTLEDDGSGNYYTIQADFRRYNNYGESLTDYANVLTGDNGASQWRYNYYLGARFSQAMTYQAATQWLTGRYATDTSYASKLNALIRDYNLTQYDMLRGAVTGNTTTTSPIVNKSESSYSVKAGESLYLIAAKNGMTVDELMKLNGLTSYLIHPNQVLKVTTTSSVSQSNVATPSTPEVKPTTPSPSTPTKPVANSGYTVKAGDSYWKIATQYGISIQELQRLNGTTNYNLYPGQQLKVPTNSTVSPSAPTTPSTPVAKPTTPSPSAPTKPVANSGYTVKAGDSYWKIATQYGISIQELQRLNGTTNYNLYPGQQLKVPTNSTVSPSAPTTPSTPVAKPTTPSPSAPTKPVANSGYTVKAGDSYWKIATQYGISIQELQRLNGTTNYNLYPGQQLKVPTSSTVSPSAPATPSTPVAKPTTPSPSAPTKPVANSGYTVKAGDSYWKIATQYGISIQELQRLNGTTNYNLYPGQQLKVPTNSTVSPSAPTTPSTPVAKPTTPSSSAPTKPVANSGYTVKAGDSYWKIATQYGISIQELQRLNGTNNYFLYPGQSIKVPGTQSSQVTPTPTPTSQTSTTVTAPTTAPSPTPATGSSSTSSVTSTSASTVAKPTTYTVKAGDTLYGIARANGLNVYDLIAQNGGKTYAQIGQVIELK